MSSILVTGIGGVVGQGILRNLRAMELGIRIVGTNTVRVSAGNHLCDAVHEVPFATAPGYIDTMRQLLVLQDVRLVLPSTDYEAHVLARHRDSLPATVASAPAEVSGLCLDKFLNFERFAERGLPFARSVLPSRYADDFPRTVVKPREGRGSRGIHVDPPDPRAFDDTHVVQEYLDGPELTTTFYVLKDGSLHGAITLRRNLDHGNTSSCEVERAYDAQIDGLLRRMTAAFPFRGSCNLQSRVTAAGVVPFEINCRISGTNSIRAQFGFPDVAYTVQELLLGQRPDAPAITGGCALRILHDVVYPDLSLAELDNRDDRFRIF
ncbi:ATP-grasp domain-containing protein [Chiayiivirga flava]|uniref:Carbamoyl-phosphate synthase large subunit n=1 Tax=Chiayiivirga flava TaxID=659595 RepID=A0A7W8D7S0_9GAMM|nr:ATP-grasp domain-containing protein [Chiayiivirga flava]MBB5209157.1 carbamoyl-phosphate synthase large subunit [Chiayiivirga flava]